MKYAIRALLLVFLIPSVIGWYYSYNCGVPVPPLSNIDYLLLLVGVCLFSRVAPGLALAACFLGVIFILSVQMLVVIGGLFVSDFWALFDYFAFVQDWPWEIFLPFIIAGVVAVAAYYYALRTVRFREVPLWAPVLALLVVLGLDSLGAANPLKLQANIVEANIATSSAVELYKAVPRLIDNSGKAPEPIDAPLKQVVLEKASPNRVLSISVEAWGLFQKDEYNARIESSLKEVLGSDYTVQNLQRVSYHGTINGEFRELCGLVILSMPSATDAQTVRDDCLPAILAAKGWKTYGLHGNSGLFYDRRRIYPALGFETVTFREDFDRIEQTPCQSIGFTGWCDRVVLRQGMKQLAQGERSFVHIMTLDTHLPLRATREEEQQCGKSNADACVYIHRFGQAFRNIAEAIAEAPVKPDIVFIWGDHPPPFIHKEARDQFFSDKVPMIILERRDPSSS